MEPNTISPFPPGSILLAFVMIILITCRGQKYFNIALVLQDECTCPLKAHAINNITE